MSHQGGRFHNLKNSTRAKLHKWNASAHDHLHKWEHSAHDHVAQFKHYAHEHSPMHNSHSAPVAPPISEAVPDFYQCAKRVQILHARMEMEAGGGGPPHPRHAEEGGFF